MNYNLLGYLPPTSTKCHDRIELISDELAQLIKSAYLGVVTSQQGSPSALGIQKQLKLDHEA